MEVQKSIEIEAAPEKIWPYLLEPEKILQWCITFQKFEYVSEKQSGVGTPLYIEEKAAGPVMKMNFLITEWRENEVVTFQLRPGSGPKAYEQSWRIETTPTSSKFTFWEEIEFPFGFLGKILGRIARPISEGTVDKMLAKLKSLVEEG